MWRGTVIYVLLPLLAGAIGMLATYALWFVLATALWLPFFLQLRQMRMYTHDIGASYLVAYGPPIVGAMFIAAAAAALIAARNLTSPWRNTIACVILLLPGFVTFFLLNPLRDLTWHYPLAEVSVFAIGGTLGWLLIRRRVLQGVR